MEENGQPVRDYYREVSNRNTQGFITFSIVSSNEHNAGLAFPLDTLTVSWMCLKLNVCGCLHSQVVNVLFGCL
jgi:hypothetical protein